MAAQCDASCVKAADCYSDIGICIAHDSFNRFLTRQSLTNETLWNEVEPYVEKRSGWFVIDDTVIDKIHSKFIEMTYYHLYSRLLITRRVGLPLDHNTTALVFLGSPPLEVIYLDVRNIQ